jgi:hypothetical protein
VDKSLHRQYFRTYTHISIKARHNVTCSDKQANTNKAIFSPRAGFP